MTVKIGCIVEGQGEEKAVPILIRRIAESLYPELPILEEKLGCKVDLVSRRSLRAELRTSVLNEMISL